MIKTNDLNFNAEDFMKKDLHELTNTSLRLDTATHEDWFSFVKKHYPLHIQIRECEYYDNNKSLAENIKCYQDAENPREISLDGYVFIPDNIRIIADSKEKNHAFTIKPEENRFILVVTIKIYEYKASINETSDGDSEIKNVAIFVNSREKLFEGYKNLRISANGEIFIVKSN